MFFQLSLPFSSLVCLHPSLPCGLPISPCFSPIFLLNCFVASHISSGRSSFFRQPSLFVLFDKTRTNFQLLLLFCQRHCLQIRLRHACVTQALRTFLFSFFKMFLSNMTPSTFPQAFAPCCVRHRISTSECSSSLTIPPTYTKPSTWLNSLSSKLMFKSSL